MKLPSFALTIFLWGWVAGGAIAQNNEKPRLLILTDIGGDPDDQQAMVRLCLYANEFDIEGIIASASGTPGELKEAIVQPQLIEEIVQAYGKVRNNLLLHHPDYPSAPYLLSRIKRGNPYRGLSYIGEDQDTEGSEWIIQMVDKSDDRPLNIAVWGGQTDLAQALWKVKNTRDKKAYDDFVSRMRIYDIADQDNIYEWIIQHFPGLLYILNNAPEGEDKRNAAFRGMYLGGDESLTSTEWINTHVREEHGPLGTLYPPKTWTAPNPHGAMKEGDTPSWFYFLPNGLSDPAHPEWGGWGGRFTRIQDQLYRDAVDQIGEDQSRRVTVWRWRPDFQSDFQARVDWCILPYAQANHAPKVQVRGFEEEEIITYAVTPSKTVSLDASHSTDPDGDSLMYSWFYYPEASSYQGNFSFHENTPSVACKIPQTLQAGETIHIILRVNDDKKTSMSAYKRIIFVNQ